MKQCNGSIDSATVVTRSELCGGDKCELVDVRKDTFGNDFLQQFATALKEADTVGLYALGRE